MSESTQERGALFAGGLAAILASACCLGPLVLVTVGFSGAWIANLTVLEPYRPLFISAALVALFFAWRRIFRPVLLILLAEVGLSAFSCRIAAPTVGSVSQGCSVLPISLGLLAAV